MSGGFGPFIKSYRNNTYADSHSVIGENSREVYSTFKDWAADGQQMVTCSELSQFCNVL